MCWFLYEYCTPVVVHNSLICLASDCQSQPSPLLVDSLRWPELGVCAKLDRGSEGGHVDGYGALHAHH
eukprot:4628365-Amphidinium_carterae.1